MYMSYPGHSATIRSQEDKKGLSAVGREIHGAYLDQCAATHGKIAVVADFEQRDAEAPLVGGDGDGRAAVDALRGDPRDPLKTLCGAGQRYLK